MQGQRTRLVYSSLDSKRSKPKSYSQHKPQTKKERPQNESQMEGTQPNLHINLQTGTDPQGKPITARKKRSRKNKSILNGHLIDTARIYLGDPYTRNLNTNREVGGIGKIPVYSRYESEHVKKVFRNSDVPTNQVSNFAIKLVNQVEKHQFQLKMSRNKSSKNRFNRYDQMDNNNSSQKLDRINKQDYRKKAHKRDNSQLVQSYRQRYGLIQARPSRTPVNKNKYSSDHQKFLKISQEQKQPAINNSTQLIKAHIKHKKMKNIQRQQERLILNLPSRLRNLRKAYLLSSQMNQAGIGSKKNTTRQAIRELGGSYSPIKVNQQQQNLTFTEKSAKKLQNEQITKQTTQKIPELRHSSRQPRSHKSTARNLRGFVINEKQQLVSRLLLLNGWKQFGELSERYTLKWTYNDCMRDYQLLRIANNSYNNIGNGGRDYGSLEGRNLGRPMFYNHLCNNRLVNKDQFSVLCQGLLLKGVNINQFIPQTFCIQTQYLQFTHSYQVRAIMAAVHKHNQYFLHKQVPLSSIAQQKKRLHQQQRHRQQNQNQHLDKKQRQQEQYRQQQQQLKNKPELQKQQHQSQPQPRSLNQQIRDFVLYLISLTDQTVDKQLKAEEQSEHFVVNICLLFNLLVMCCDLWIGREGEDSDEFDLLYKGVVGDSGVMNKVIAIGRSDMMFEKYEELRSSSQSNSARTPNHSQLPAKSLSLIQGHLKTTKPFLTPSPTLIHGITLFEQYFSSSLSNNFKGGLRNLWIIKPGKGSKGRGIEIVDKVDKVARYADGMSNRVVQKYIENVWTLDARLLGVFETTDMVKGIVNRKFDIRQWVLLIPPYSYIFSSFYIRICSKQYKFQLLTDPCSHLSNFAINRQKFPNAQQSVLSQHQFQLMLKKINKHAQYFSLKQKLANRLKLLIDQALLQAQPIPGTFEVIGFDVLIDEEFNPWVIECNRSPACSARTEWLRQMKEAMTVGVLELVLGSELLGGVGGQGGGGSVSEYRWELLGKTNLGMEKQKDYGFKQPLEISGTRIRPPKKRKKSRSSINNYQQAPNEQDPTTHPCHSFNNN